MALFCVISANSGSFRAHCVKVHVRYLISWWVLVDDLAPRQSPTMRAMHTKPSQHYWTEDCLCGCVTQTMSSEKLEGRQTDRHTQWQRQTEFIICPMLYAIAMGQLIMKLNTWMQGILTVFFIWTVEVYSLINNSMFICLVFDVLVVVGFIRWRWSKRKDQSTSTNQPSLKVHPTCWFTAKWPLFS